MSIDRSLKQGRASGRIRGKLVIPSPNVIRAKRRDKASRQFRLVRLAEEASFRGIPVFELQREKFAEVARIRKKDYVGRYYL
mgnify:CR=1 FL=1